MSIEQFLTAFQYEQSHYVIAEKDPWVATFLENITQKCFEGKPLSQKQRDVVVKNLEKYRDLIYQYNPKSKLDDALLIGFTSKLYNTVSKNEIKYIGNNKISLKFKQNSNVNKDSIKKIGLDGNYNRYNPYVLWNNTYKIWIVDVNNFTIKDILEIVADEKSCFNIDNETVELLENMTIKTDRISTFELQDDGIYCEIEDNYVIDSWIMNSLNGQML